VSEANGLNRLLDVLRCANSEVVKLRFEADCTMLQAKRDEYIVAISGRKLLLNGCRFWIIQAKRRDFE
jgi:hypothetical protein